MSIRIFSAAALLTGFAQAAQVHVHNHCDFQVKADPFEGSSDGDPAHYLNPGDTYSTPAEGSAMCLKLYGPHSDSPTQLEWSTWTSAGKDILSYDLSNIDIGQATTFLQHGMNLTSQDPECDSESANCRPAICKPQGAGKTQPCEDAYNQPFDVRTLGASAQYDLDMHLCTVDSGSSDSSDSEDAPAPSQTTLATRASTSAPASSSYGGSGPVPVKADAQGNVFEGEPEKQADGNVVTTWVQNTEVVTHVITARNAEPTLEKRYGHPHGHQGRHKSQ